MRTHLQHMPVCAATGIRREKNSQSASSRSSSSSSSGSVTLEACADTEQLRPDIFEAIDDAALKIFSHALKPVNTLLYGMQDLEGVFSGKVALKDGTADPRRCNHVFGRQSHTSLRMEQHQW